MFNCVWIETHFLQFFNNCSSSFLWIGTNLAFLHFENIALIEPAYLRPLLIDFTSGSISESDFSASICGDCVSLEVETRSGDLLSDSSLSQLSDADYPKAFNHKCNFFISITTPI